MSHRSATREISLRITPGRDAPRLSRARLAEMRPHIGSRFDDLSLIVTELVTNSVRHGNGIGKIEVSVRSSPERIRLEVTDPGTGFRHKDTSGGIGLRIVDQLSERWGVEVDDHCTVWVELSPV